MSSFDDVIKDLEKQRKRARDAKHLETAFELGWNVYPALIALVRALDERISETEAEVIALIQQTESVIQPELSTQILAMLDLVKVFCSAVLADTTTSDILRQQATSLLAALEETAQRVEEVSIDDSDEAADEDINMPLATVTSIAPQPQLATVTSIAPEVVAVKPQTEETPNG